MLLSLAGLWNRYKINIETVHVELFFVTAHGLLGIRKFSVLFK